MQSTALVVAVLAVIIGAVWCFFGLRFYRLVLALYGMVAGAAIGYQIAQAANITDTNTTYIIAILGAIILGFVFYRLYRLQFVIAGAILGVALALYVIAAFAVSGQLVQVVIIAIGAVVGMSLGRGIANLVIRLSTAISGAGLMVAGILLFFPTVAAFDSQTNALNLNLDSGARMLVIGIIIVVAILGFFVQGRTKPAALAN